MQKKFIELGVDEIQTVVGGVKTAAVAHVSRPINAHATMAAPSRPAISVPSLPKR